MKLVIMARVQKIETVNPESNRPPYRIGAKAADRTGWIEFEVSDSDVYHCGQMLKIEVTEEING